LLFRSGNGLWVKTRGLLIDDCGRIPNVQKSQNGDSLLRFNAKKLALWVDTVGSERDVEGALDLIWILDLGGKCDFKRYRNYSRVELANAAGGILLLRSTDLDQTRHDWIGKNVDDAHWSSAPLVEA